MTGENDLFVQKALAGQPIDHCLVIDAHGHLGENPTFPIIDTDPASVVASMDRIGIDALWVSALPAIYGGYAERGNAIVETAIHRYPQRLFGYTVVDIGYPDRVIPTLEHGQRAGFTGIKIYSPIGNVPAPTYASPNYEPLYNFADVHHLPILAHTWGSELDDLEPWIKRYPNVNILLAHTGSAQLEKYIRFGREYPNVFLELCYSLSPRGFVELLVREGLADKVVWGSDTVFMSATQQIGRVLFAKISPEDKEKILGLNAKRALYTETT